MSQKYVVNDNKVYEVNDNKLFTTYDEVEIPEQEVTPIWKGAKIPLTMWQTIVKFCKHSYDELKSETLIYLFYDENAEQPWSWWVPPQTTSGMTVKSDPDHVNYAAQRAQYPDTMFGTVHHHCSTSAFQSGTDEADETQREGLHFTVGNLNKDNDFDVHFRMTIGNNHAEIDAHTYIEMDENPFKRNARVPKATQDHVRTELHKFAIKQPINKDIDFTDEMANVAKAYASLKTPALSQKSLGWYDEPYYMSKKNEDVVDISIHDVVDDLINAVIIDPEYETILTNYYIARGDQNKLSLFTAGAVFDADIAKELHTVFNDYAYQKAHPRNFAEGVSKVEEFLKEQSKTGLDFSFNDLNTALSTYEEGTGLQSLANETFL